MFRLRQRRQKKRQERLLQTYNIAPEDLRNMVVRMVRASATDAVQDVMDRYNLPFAPLLCRYQQTDPLCGLHREPPPSEDTPCES